MFTSFEYDFQKYITAGIICSDIFKDKMSEAKVIQIMNSILINNAIQDEDKIALVYRITSKYLHLDL